MRTSDVKAARKIAVEMADNLDSLFRSIRSGNRLLSMAELEPFVQLERRQKTEALIVESLENFDSRRQEGEEWESFHARTFKQEVLREALGSVESSGLKPPKKYNDWKGVLKAIEQYHEPIAHHFYKSVGNELQVIDSQIVEMVLLELIKENTIALPVHDSFRYKVKDMQLLIKKMNVATKHYLGSELFITLEHQALNEPPKALTTSNSNYYSRRNNFLKRFNKVEEPFETYLL